MIYKWKSKENGHELTIKAVYNEPQNTTFYRVYVKGKKCGAVWREGTNNWAWEINDTGMSYEGAETFEQAVNWVLSDSGYPKFYTAKKEEENE